MLLFGEKRRYCAFFATENPRVVGSIPTGGINHFIINKRSRGFSSFGRARPCQGRGGGFEPRNPLHFFA